MQPPSKPATIKSADKSAEIIGYKKFVMETKAKLGAKAIGRRELENNEEY